MHRPRHELRSHTPGRTSTPHPQIDARALAIRAAFAPRLAEARNLPAPVPCGASAIAAPLRPTAAHPTHIHRYLGREVCTLDTPWVRVLRKNAPSTTRPNAQACAEIALLGKAEALCMGHLLTRINPLSVTITTLSSRWLAMRSVRGRIERRKGYPE